VKTLAGAGLGSPYPGAPMPGRLTSADRARSGHGRATDELPPVRRRRRSGFVFRSARTFEFPAENKKKLFLGQRWERLSGRPSDRMGVTGSGGPSSSISTGHKHRVRRHRQTAASRLPGNGQPIVLMPGPCTSRRAIQRLGRDFGTSVGFAQNPPPAAAFRFKSDQASTEEAGELRKISGNLLRTPARPAGASIEKALISNIEALHMMPNCRPAMAVSAVDAGTVARRHRQREHIGGRELTIPGSQRHDSNQQSDRSS